MAIGGTALPSSDRRAFAELMLSRELRSYRAAERLSIPVFSDRGIPDIIGYLTLVGLPVLPHMDEAAGICRYHEQQAERDGYSATRRLR